jgi:ribosomal protein S12 methylthiotransferase accessory factor
VVVATDHLRPALSHAFNTWAAEMSRPWLNVTTDGTELLVGPIVVPGQTACFNCLEIQDEATRQYRHDFLVYKDAIERDGSLAAVSTPAAYLAASWAALAVAQFEQSGPCFLVDRLLRIDLDRLDVVAQRVFALPRCPVCARTRHDLRHAFL